MKNIFDFNVHISSFNPKLIKKLDTEYAVDMLNFEKNYDLRQLNKFTINFKSEIKKTLFKNYLYNLMVFTSKVDFKLLKNVFCKTILCDYKTKNINKYFKDIKNAKINAIKFHPYFQKIDNSDFEKCVKLALSAEKYNLPILIDASVGGENLYKINNLELILEISKKIKRVPIVILHSGGIKILEAFLIAENSKNVFLDTSFSVNYFKNFPILKTYQEVYKRLGPDRIVYGSDFPYCDLKKSFQDNLKLLKKTFNSKSDLSKIFYVNAKKIFFNN